jgi:hypothetical protein
MNSICSTWKFGALRHVVVNPDPTVWKKLDYLRKTRGVVDLLAGRELRVIGEADRMTALVLVGDDQTVHALFQGETWTLFPVAANVANLVGFLDDVAGLWFGHENRYTLDTSNENRELAELMLDEFVAANPGCDVGFWEYHCLAGLNMGFPLG